MSSEKLKSSSEKPGSAIDVTGRDEAEYDREYLPKSLYEFVTDAWHIIEPAVPLVRAWYVGAICEHLQAVSDGEIKDLIINVPPRTAKSSLVSVLWPTWEWTRRPALRSIFASYSLRLSLRDSLRRRNILTNPWYQARWGDRVVLSRDQREKSDFKNSAQGEMFCTSTGGTVTGFGGLRLILDDPQDPKGVESELTREGTVEWLSKTWPSRKDSPEAAEVLIQQRLHEKDATGLYLKLGDAVLLKIPMEYDGKPNKTIVGFEDPRTEEGQVIDEERFPPKFLAKLKRRLGPYGVAGQLQQEPAPVKGGIIKRSWIKEYEELDDGRISIRNGDYIYNWRDNVRFCTVDLAVREEEIGGPKKGTKHDPDYNVFAAWSLLPTERGAYIILLDLIRERLEAPDIIPKLKDFHKSYNFNVIGIESVQFQLSVVQYARRAGLPVREIARKKSDKVLYYIDADKTARAMSATPLMADDRFWVPAYRPWLADYISELTKFPNADHDDQVDATAYGVAIGEAIPSGPRRPPKSKNSNGDSKGVPEWLLRNQREADFKKRFGRASRRNQFGDFVPGVRRP